MSGQLLISDANIIIDMDTGGLLRPMFGLDVTFAVPNILFEEELRATHPELLKLGLQSLELRDQAVEYADRLVEKYQPTGASTNDLVALALAAQEKCPLLTGDSRLRNAGKAEGIEVHGTIWLVGQMLEDEVITAKQAEASYEKKRRGGRWLPWEEVAKQLAAFKK